MLFSAFILFFIETVALVSCIDYRVGPQRGWDGGRKNYFECPYNGAITGMKYRSGARVDQVEFICTSSKGITSFGPYGGNGGWPGQIFCPQGQYISSIYGRSYASVDRLGIRCRNWDDMIGRGASVGEFGGWGGDAFDELDFSIGYRPIRITIQSHFEVYAIQVTYSNIPVERICTDCGTYVEEWSPKHGGGGGYMNQFICPNQGVITGIKYRSWARLDSIQFKCTSSSGEASFGPYGGNGGAGPFEENCPKGYYIGSIHGRSWASVDALGIRCVKVDQLISSDGVKYDAHGGGGGQAFDDENYQSRRLRPVQIEVWSYAEVDSIRIKYGNMPVAINCRVTKIEVMDKNIVAQADGYEVIGITTGSSCSTNTQVIRLDYSQTVSETIGVETTEGGEINWGTELSLSFTSELSIGGFKSDVTVGLTQSAGGSKSWSSTTLKQTTTESQKAQGTDVTYTAPGACILVGFLTRYRINRDKVPVLYHSTCDGGSIPPQGGTIKLTSKVYGKADFQDYQFVFNNLASCTSAVRTCVRSISGTVTDPQALETAFKSCFPEGSGTFY